MPLDHHIVQLYFRVAINHRLVIHGATINNMLQVLNHRTFHNTLLNRHQPVGHQLPVDQYHHGNLHLNQATEHHMVPHTLHILVEYHQEYHQEYQVEFQVEYQVVHQVDLAVIKQLHQVCIQAVHIKDMIKHLKFHHLTMLNLPQVVVTQVVQLLPQVHLLVLLLLLSLLRHLLFHQHHLQEVESQLHTIHNKITNIIDKELLIWPFLCMFSSYYHRNLIEVITSMSFVLI